MTAIPVRWRTKHKGLPPQPIKLRIPGWSGHGRDHGDVGIPQPWHSPPFVEGSTYGLELRYPLEAECRVSICDRGLDFQGDFDEELDPSSMP